MQNEDTQIKYIKIGSNHKAIKDLQVKREEAQEAYDLAIEDTKWKQNTRKSYNCFFLSLIAIQNAIVFGLVIWAFVTNKLADLSIVLGVIITGTLVETYFLLRIMVYFVFSEIDYTKLKK
jgi:hypothetical protein